jgi:hypothetical protein
MMLIIIIRHNEAEIKICIIKYNTQMIYCGNSNVSNMLKCVAWAPKSVEMNKINKVLISKTDNLSDKLINNRIQWCIHVLKKEQIYTPTKIWNLKVKGI